MVVVRRLHGASPGLMAYRRTLKRGVGCTGIGLHTGRAVRLDLKPAPAEHGIRFRRTDVGVEIPAHIDHLGRLDHATTLSRESGCRARRARA